ncbi:hypothetical protein BGZ83_005521 [Gryganskiella cystojenkinii]|nr:hypothetical protein BGZ83_005521 [Gryganskiella cystojenkinii]
MEERNRSLEFSRSLSMRNARAAQKEKALMQSILKSKSQSTEPTLDILKRPAISQGHVSDLFGVENLQNRAVLPGDFVEIRRQDFDQMEGRLHSSSVTQGGKVLYHRTADVVFRIPGYLFFDNIKAQVGHWDVAANPTSPPLGAGKTAVTFADEAIIILGTHYTKFNKLYDTFWHSRKRTSLTTPEAAKFVFNKESEGSAPLTLQEIYATHMYLTQDANLTMFTPSVAVRWTGEFAMRPPPAVLTTKTVIDWMHKEDPRIAQFLEKSKKLIQSYRAGEDRSAGLWKETTFTDSDRTIIEFVRQAAFFGYDEMFRAPQLTHLPQLLRPLSQYEDISAQTAFLFLNEIGIWPNWYNLEVNRSAVALSSYDKDGQAIMERIRQLHPDSLQRDFEQDITRIKKQEKCPAKVDKARPLVLQSPTEMYKVDPCDSIRHDFGTQSIYAIDDPSASELDDAFSIEPVPVTTLTPEASTWVHVHVADPTSILPPTHELARLAGEKVQTAYLPERSWPMLPRALTEGALSLSNDGRPQKVMTFSVRMSDRGEFLEYKVRPGIVRSVKTLNYDDVDSILSWDRVDGGTDAKARIDASTMRTPEASEHMLEREYYRPSTGSVNTEDKSLVSELQRLQVVAQSHADSRLRSGAVNFSLSKSTIELTPYPLKPVAEQGWKRPIDYSKWQEPQISVTLDRAFASPSRMMVAEFMVLAGRVASLFAQDHQGLPMLYRNQAGPMEKYSDMFSEALSKKSMVTGMLGVMDMLPLRPYISGAEIATVSKGHWSMGISDGYIKVTSPLRRYSDMVSHWQIKGQLLKNASKNASSAPPIFDLETLDSLTGHIRDRERALGMLEARSVKFWLTEMLRRRAAAGLSSELEGMILNPTMDGYNVLSTRLGFQTVVKADPEVVEQTKIGDRVLFEVNNFNSQRPYIGAKHVAVL